MATVWRWFFTRQMHLRKDPRALIHSLSPPGIAMFLKARRPTTLIAVALVVLGLNLLSVGQAQAAPSQAGQARADLVSGPAQAAPLKADLAAGLAPAAPPRPDYVPGAASASKPGYDPALWSKTYKCQFPGWVRVQVNWQCALKTPGGVTLSSHTGYFTSGSYSTPLYYYKTANTYLCTFASAGYADGSGYDSSQSCQ